MTADSRSVPPSTTRDRWAQWLLHTRHAGDPARLEQMLPDLRRFRDTVLEHADLRADDVVLDVGCGDGLLGFGAIDRLGSTGRVIFTDLSRPLLDRCRELAADLGVEDRCRYVLDRLPELGQIEDASVDAAMTRSVLIYVADKASALENMYRVLRRGGRLSIFEPINSFGWPEPEDRLWGFDITGHEDAAVKVKRRFADAQPDARPMIDFDERDLLTHAERAGFREIHLDHQVTIAPQPPGDLDRLLRHTPNPLSPPLGTVLSEALDPAEKQALLHRIQEQIDAGRRWQRGAVAYLWATK